MASEGYMQRGITSTRTVAKQQQSSIHHNAMVLEPGLWDKNDPFLFLAEDWFQKGTFDVHPHRGIETVTYVIEGRLGHYDNQFGEGTLGPGDVQWMTAGSGVIHKEEPLEGDTVHSLQLWVNLPRDQKMTRPRYQNLRSQDMPVRHEDGVTIRVFSGSSGDVTAQTLNYVPVTMVEITAKAGSKVTQDLPGDYRGFLYVLEGTGIFGSNQQSGNAGQVLWMEDGQPTSNTEISIEAQTDLRVLLYAGRPLHEPVVAYGPFVMNTKEQIMQAFEDYQSGRFAQS